MRAEPRPRSRSGVASWLCGNATLVGALFVGGLAVCLTWSGFDVLQADSYRLLYAGRYIAQHGLPHGYVFTSAGAGRAYVDQQWLAELISYETWKVAGYGGLAVLCAGVFGSGYALLVGLISRRRGSSVPLSIACATIAVFGALSLAFVRAQVFVVPLFVALLWVCLQDFEADRLRPRVVVVVGVLVLWANLHGSILVGAAMAGLYFLARTIVMLRRHRPRTAGVYAILAAICVLTPFATPFGGQTIAYYHSMIGNGAVKLADIEWDAPAFPALSFFQFALPLLLALTAVILGVVRHRWPQWPLVGPVVICAIAAWFGMRNNIWLGIATAILVADAAATWVPTGRIGPAFVTVLTLAGACLAVVGLGRLATRPSAGFEAQAPLQAIVATATYTNLHADAQVLADSTSASALLWHDPAIAGRVAFDGELEIYPQSSLTSWVQFQTAQTAGWLTAASGYQVLLAASSDHPALVRKLTRLPNARLLAYGRRGVAVIPGWVAQVSVHDRSPNYLGLGKRDVESSSAFSSIPPSRPGRR